MGCVAYYTCTDLWCKICTQSLYFPNALVILPTLWHRLDSKSVITYAYFCAVNLRGKDKRSVYEVVLEDINNYSSVYIIKIHTWSTRQVRKLAEALFFKVFLRSLSTSHPVQNLKVQDFVTWLKDRRGIDIIQIRRKGWSMSESRVADIFIMLSCLSFWLIFAHQEEETFCSFWSTSFIKIGDKSGKLSAFLHKQINILILC